MENNDILGNLGWQAFFQQQLSLDEWENAIPGRVIEQSRSELHVATTLGTVMVHVQPSMPTMVVGDWLLLNNESRFLRLPERKTCFSRKAAGTKLTTQLISANVDTAFIVSSMNNDFNLNRIERFLALVNEAGAEAVVVLSKADQTNSPADFIHRIQSLDSFLAVESVNGLEKK